MRVQEPYTIFKRSLPSGKSVYYFQFRLPDGTRSIAKSTGQTTLAKARLVCKRLYDSGAFSQHCEVTFANFAEGFFDDGSEYLKWKEACGSPLRPETLRSYRMLLSKRLLPFFGGYELSKITVDSVKRWIVWLTERWSVKSSNNAQSALNIILKSAHEKGLIQMVPSIGLSFRKINKKRRVLLTVQEIRGIYYAWDDDVSRRAFLLAAVTGMRIGEVCGLLSSNVFDGYVRVEHTLTPRNGLGDTKTGVHRYVPVPSRMRVLDNCGIKWAFDDGGRPLPVHNVYNRMMRLCARLGIDTKTRGITVHSLRNFFISYLRGHGVPDSKVKAVVGHADENMTDWYTYWTLDMFGEVVEAQEILFDKITGEPNEN